MYVVDHPPQVLRLEAVIKFLLEARLERGERRRHRLPRQPRRHGAELLRRGRPGRLPLGGA